MKNLHLLPTEKASRLVENSNENTLKLCIQSLPLDKEICCIPQHIYITNDAYIGLSYYLDGDLVRKGVIDDQDYWAVRRDFQKIIVTTDIDLIKDGVQAIDDEFLEWFVNNSSCEFVEVVLEDIEQPKPLYPNGNHKGERIWIEQYKIIIPKEESKPHSFCETPNEKCTMNYCDENGCMNRSRELVEPSDNKQQETLEEAAEKYVNKFYTTYAFKGVLQNLFTDGAKSDAAKDYWFEQFLKHK